MPELPEVETMRRGVLAAVGTTIAAVERPRSKLQSIKFTPDFSPLRRRILGRTITEIGRRGKRVLLGLDDRSLVVIEPRMTGLVLVADPPNETHLRLVLHLEPASSAQAGSRDCSRLMFWDQRGLGTVTWLAAEKIDSVLGPHRIGPDALEISADELRLRLRSSRRAVKVALLDQKIVAGIGNLYASEILHLAGVDPRATCHRLSADQWERIIQSTRAVLQEAIRFEGSTLSDGTYRNALNNPGSYQNHHRVYDRAGTPCPRCQQGEILRIVQTQRSTYYCPKCQQRRGKHPLVPAV